MCCPCLLRKFKSSVFEILMLFILIFIGAILFHQHGIGITITGNLGVWLGDLLSNSTQCVRIKDYISDTVQSQVESLKEQFCLSFF